MKSNTLQTQHSNPRYVYSLDEELTETSPAENNVGGLMDEKLDKKQ